MIVLVKACYKLLDCIWDLVIVQNFLNQFVVHLAKSVVKVKKCNDKSSMLGSSFAYHIPKPCAQCAQEGQMICW